MLQISSERVILPTKNNVNALTVEYTAKSGVNMTAFFISQDKKHPPLPHHSPFLRLFQSTFSATYNQYIHPPLIILSCIKICRIMRLIAQIVFPSFILAACRESLEEGGVTTLKNKISGEWLTELKHTQDNELKTTTDLIADKVSYMNRYC